MQDKELQCSYPIFAAAAALLLGAAAGLAQGVTPALSFEGKTVQKVVYVPPQQPLATADLDRLQQVKAGTPYSGKDVSATIDRLFATRAYSDIQADVEDSPAGLTVRFLTKSALFTGHIRVTGKVSDPPSRTSIADTAHFRPGTPFDDEALAEAEKNIRQLFTNNGLYEANVTLEKNIDPDTSLVHVTIDVKSGKRARYQTPQILGQPKLSDSTIVRATGWRVILIHRWRSVSQSLTDTGIEGIRKKYKQKDLLTASVELDGVDYDPDRRRLTPRLQLNAGPAVHLEAQGAKVSKSRMKRLVPVYEEGAADDDLLFEGSRNLRDYFQSNGYPDADVDFQRNPLKDDTLTIDFIITKGQQRKLKKIDIQGNKYFASSIIRERLYLLPASFRFRKGRYSEAFRKRDQETIEALYRANGFRDVKVSSTAQDQYQGKPGQIAVTYKIEEGTQWLVGKVTTEGMEEDDLTALREQLSDAEGQPFSEVNLAADRNLILSYYYKQGFAKAEVEWRLTPAPDKHAVDLVCRVTTGDREFIRDVRILGLTRTRPSLVQKHLNVHTGQPLSLIAIDGAQRDLDNLGVFARVDSAVQNADGTQIYKDVLYDVDEAARYNVRIGVGAEIAQLGAATTTLSAPTSGTGFSPRFLLNVNRIDFLGRDHTISFDGRYSNLERRAALNYTVPNFFGSQKRTLTFTALYDLASNVRTFTARREEAAVQVSQKLSKPSTLQLRYAYRRVSTSNIAIPDLLVPQLAQPITIGIISANYVQDRRDNPVNAHHGIYNTLDVAVAARQLGSQRNFIRALARNATYTALPWHMVLARQLTFGVIQPYNLGPGLSAGDAVPLPERFFGGGNLTHRGFGENQAGPRDIGTMVGADGTATQPTGFPIGGNALLFHNTELRFPLLGANIDGVVFHDMGNIYTSLSAVSFRFHQNDNQDFNYMVHAVGFGIRYRTPVGPIRVDLAYSINPPRFVGFNGTINQLLNCNPNLPTSQLPAYCVGVPQQLNHFQFFFSIGQTF